MFATPDTNGEKIGWKVGSSLRLVETERCSFSLLLDAGTTNVDELIMELGHEPNGYFWEGVAQFLIKTEAPSLEARLSFDPEGGMFCAYARERTALEELGNLMNAVATDGNRMRTLIQTAKDAGFEFDD